MTFHCFNTKCPTYNQQNISDTLHVSSDDQPTNINATNPKFVEVKEYVAPYLAKSKDKLVSLRKLKVDEFELTV